MKIIISYYNIIVWGSFIEFLKIMIFFSGGVNPSANAYNNTYNRDIHYWPIK